MRFRLTGADRITGREIVLTIDANSEEEAASIASARGLVTASVTKLLPPTIDQLSSAPPSEAIDAVDDHGLVAAGKWLGAYANWITWAGAVYAISGAFIVAIGFSIEEHTSRVLSVAAGASAIVSGLFVLASGAVLRMIRAMALVLLDISQTLTSRDQR